MMQAWAVIIRTYSKTWIDTVWVVETSDKQRLDLLAKRLDKVGLLGEPVGCWVAELVIEDAGLDNTKP